MAHLIDKAAVVAEIKKRIKETESMQPKFDQSWAGQISAFKGVLKIIDTFDTKEVEEPNASDRGIAEEIVINLKRIEQDYRIDLTKEIEWLRNIVKKRE